MSFFANSKKSTTEYSKQHATMTTELLRTIMHYCVDKGMTQEAVCISLCTKVLVKELPKERNAVRRIHRILKNIDRDPDAVFEVVAYSSALEHGVTTITKRGFLDALSLPDLHSVVIHVYIDSDETAVRFAYIRDDDGRVTKINVEVTSGGADCDGCDQVWFCNTKKNPRTACENINLVALKKAMMILLKACE